MLQRFSAGDTLAFDERLPDYPASSGWTLNYRLVPRSGGTAYTFASTASGDLHAISVAAATTAAWVPGTYTWASWVGSGALSHSIGSGTLTVLPNPRTAAGPLDLRSDAEVALDNVRATIRGKASADVLRYTIAGRSLERYAMSELVALESQLALQVRREQRAATLAAGGADPRRLSVRLGRA